MHFTSPQREYDDVETGEFENKSDSSFADVTTKDTPVVSVRSYTKNSVFAYIVQYGHDEDFVPQPIHEPTDALPGTGSKIQELRTRVALGLDLWHPDDRLNAAGDTISAIWPKPKATVVSSEGKVGENVLMLRQQLLSSLLQPTKKPTKKKELPKPRQPKPKSVFSGSTSNVVQQSLNTNSNPISIPSLNPVTESVALGTPAELTAEQMSEIDTLFAGIVVSFGERCNKSGLRDFNAIMSGEALQGAYHFSLITEAQYHQMLERIADTLLKH